MQDQAGTDSRVLHWTEADDAAAFLHKLQQSYIQDADAWAATWFDADAFWHKMVKDLRVAIESRNGTKTQTYTSLIEVLGDQWWLTEYGLECVTHPYEIGADRAKETDWLDHMREKDWVDFQEFKRGLATLRALHASKPQLFDELAEWSAEEPTPSERGPMTNEKPKVFIVHGHDLGAAYEIGHYVEREFDCKSVILKDETDAGQTEIRQ